MEWNMFYALLQRDLRVYRYQISRLIVADAICRAILYTTVFGYLLPEIGFISHEGPQGVMYLGTIMFSLFPLANSINYELLLDYVHERHFDFMIYRSSIICVYAEKLFFGTITLWVSISAFLGVSKIILQDRLDTTMLNIPSCIIILGAISLFITSLVLLAYSYMRSILHTRIFWRRFIFPFTFLSGYLVPLHVIAAHAPKFAFFMHINPMVYILEGIRRAFFGSSHFISIPVCTTVLICGSIACSALGIYFLRKKLDCL